MPGEQLPFGNNIDQQEKIEAGKEQSDTLRDAKVDVHNLAHQPTAGIDDQPLQNVQELMAGKVEISDDSVIEETNSALKDKFFQTFLTDFQWPTDAPRPIKEKCESFKYKKNGKGEILLEMQYKVPNKLLGTTSVVAHMKIGEVNDANKTIIFKPPFDADSFRFNEEERETIAKKYEKNGYTYESDNRIAKQ